MSENATRLIETFDQLDPPEQHLVVVSLLRRAGELPSHALTDDDLCGSADNLLSSLDDKENGSSNSPRR